MPEVRQNHACCEMLGCTSVLCHLSSVIYINYFAYSTYLLSRTTVTLIWPG